MEQKQTYFEKKLPMETTLSLSLTHTHTHTHICLMFDQPTLKSNFAKADFAFCALKQECERVCVRVCVCLCVRVFVF